MTARLAWPAGVLAMALVLVSVLPGTVRADNWESLFNYENGEDVPVAALRDASDNVYVLATCDNGDDDDVVVFKVEPDGDIVDDKWVYDTEEKDDCALGFVLDEAHGAIYVLSSVDEEEFYVVKFLLASQEPAWVVSYEDATFEPAGIVLQNLTGDVGPVIVGHSETAQYDYDVRAIRWNSNGSKAWSHTHDWGAPVGLDQNDIAYSVGTGDDNYVYVAGRSNVQEDVLGDDELRVVMATRCGGRRSILREVP